MLFGNSHFPNLNYMVSLTLSGIIHLTDDLMKELELEVNVM